MSPGRVWLLPVGLLLVALMVCGCVHPTLIPSASVFMIRPEFERIRTSRNQRNLERLMIELIQSGNEEELSFVAQMLVDPEFLARLDTPFGLYAATQQVRFNRVIDAFLRRKEPYLDQLLAWMVSAPALWGSDFSRAQRIYETMATLVPLSRTRIELVVALAARLDEVCVGILLSDGSPEALAVLLRILPAIPLDKIYKVEILLKTKAITDWFSQYYIDFARVAVSTSSIRPVLRFAILDGFFGFPDGKHVPPSPEPFFRTYYFRPYTDGSNEALLGLLDLAKRGHELTLSPQLHDALVAAERKIRGILEERGVR